MKFFNSACAKTIKYFIEHKKMIFFIILLIILLVVLGILLSSVTDKIFTKIDDVTRVLYQISTIIGIVGVLYAIKSFKKAEEDTKQTERSKLMENSIEVLGIFSSNIIPQIEKFDRDVEVSYDNLIQSIKKQIFEENGKKLEVQQFPENLIKALKLQAKTSSGGYRLMNQLEQVCAYIKYDLIIPDVVYPTIHSMFLRFLDENEDLLEKVTSEDAPYFNVNGVRDKWSKISEEEALAKQQREIDRKRADLKETKR